MKKASEQGATNRTAKDSSSLRYFFAALPPLPAEEGGNFVPIATDGHGTPAATTCTGVIVEEQAAGRIRTTADGGAGTFNQEFSGRARNRGEEPFQAIFARHKVQGPGVVAAHQFVVPFRDAQDFVDGLDPRTGERFLVHEGSEDGAERLAKAQNAQEDSVNGTGFVGEERAQASRAIFGDQACVHEERHKFFPRKVAGVGRDVGEVQGEAASDEVKRGRGRAARGHITNMILLAGYNRELGKGEGGTFSRPWAYPLPMKGNRRRQERFEFH